MRWAIARILFCLAVLCLSACSEERPLQPEPVPTWPVIHDPWEDEEAEELAMWMSGELVAPKKLYDRVLMDLHRIRSTWGDSVPEIRYVGFYARQEPGWVRLRLGIAGVNRIAEGTHREFDSLNALLGATSVSRGLFGDDLVVRFSSRLNPCLLKVMYAQLAGVIETYGNGRVRWSGEELYFAKSGDEIVYIFKGCSSFTFDGCNGYTYLCFRTAPGGREYLGEWTPRSDTSLPQWHSLLETARANRGCR